MDSDIEEQLPNKQMEDGEVPVNSSHPPHQQQHHPAAGNSRKSCLATLCQIIVMALWIDLYAAFLFALVLSIPVSLSLMAVIIHSLPKKRLTKFENSALEISSEEGIGGMYQRSRRQDTSSDWTEFTFIQLIAYVSLAMLAGLVLSLWVPRLRTTRLLGSPLWKWSSLGVTLTAAYFEAVTVTFLIFILTLVRKETDLVYYGRAWFMSLGAVAYFGMVLASWLLYFGTEQGLKQASTPHPQAFEHVTWTIASLCVGSVLWLLKALLLARWSADAIYRRFEPRLLITAVKFFFIGLSAAGFFEEYISQRLDKVLDEYGGDKTEQRRTSVTKYIMSRKTELNHLRCCSVTLMSLPDLMSQLLDLQEEDGIDQFANWFQHHTKEAPTHKCGPVDLLIIFCRPKEAELASRTDKGAEAAGPTSSPKKDETTLPSSSPEVAGPTFYEIFSNAKNGFCQNWKNFEHFKSRAKNTWQKLQEMAHLLYKLVQEERSSNAFTFEDLNIWMVDAHKDCINMGRTLADAKANVNRLDIFMSFVIVVIVLLLWLLLTGTASTAVLVTVATPILALTFIFGDTAKSFFQGLIFCFATHPFDVGDRCIIDETELEVKNVNVLTTTFNRIGSKEKRMYPNSQLATKAIVNLGWQPDPTDTVELTLHSSTDLKYLRKKMQEFFEKEKTCYKNSCDVMIKEVGESIKVAVHFTHVLTVNDLSHNQCYKKKSKQRSDILKVIRKCINKSQIQQLDIKDANENHMPYLHPSRSAQLLNHESQR